MTSLVCVHGFLGSSSDFLFLSKDKEIKCLDLSMNLRRFSLKQFALDLYEQLQKHKIRKASFAGYSMGGRVLLELYRHYPDVFEKLILISSSPGLLTALEREDRLRKDMAWADFILKNLKTPDVFFNKWYSQDIFKNFCTSKNFKDHLQSRAKKLCAKHAEIVLEASPGGNPGHFDLLSQMQIPLMVLLGEFDKKYRDLWSNLVAKHPKIELKIIPQAGHVVHLENPEKTRDAIKEFIT